MPHSKRSTRVRVATAEALDQRIGALERLLKQNEQTCGMLDGLPPSDDRRALLASNRASRLRLTGDLASARAARKNVI